MKSFSLKDQIEEDESSADDQMTKAIVDALSANDRVIEIRPAKRTGGLGLKGLLLLGVGAIGFAYWVRNSQRPDDFIEGIKEKTADQTHQAAETIEDGSEAVSEQIEEGSERASEAVEEGGKKAAEQTEEAGEKVADETDSDEKTTSTL